MPSFYHNGGNYLSVAQQVAQTHLEGLGNAGKSVN
jgi:hypothetical protein